MQTPERCVESDCLLTILSAITLYESLFVNGNKILQDPLKGDRLPADGPCWLQKVKEAVVVLML